jgi:hypothetical protein
MASARTSSTTTEEYVRPSGDAPALGPPALLCVFPREVALPLPPPGEPVGRAWLAQANIRDVKASGEHLSFPRRDGRVHVEDLSSRNGTWLNGEPIPAKRGVALDDGDVLRLGYTVLVYRAAFAGPLSPAAPLGKLVGPWGLGELRARLLALPRSGERNVLIEGETGTGKELVADAVVDAIGRAGKPRTTINVAAIPAGVFEAQLFGWKRGAHSGATHAGKGIFQEHDGGTVFLDEIGELPLDLQPKLLRLIEYGQVQPVGGSPVKVDVAVIAATNRSLADAVETGAFRRDLHARFSERIALPALADRPEDVFSILQTLTRRRGAQLDETRADVDAVERILLDRWPANVRDLDRVAAAFAAEGHLSRALVDGVLGPRRADVALTREVAARMVQECGGNERAAERRFGIKRGKLRRALGKAGKGGRSAS